MSRYSEASQRSSPGSHYEDSHSEMPFYTPTHVSNSAQSAMSTRCSQIKSELDAVNAELASLRAGRQSGTEPFASSISDASSLRPQDSISSVSSRRGTTKPRSYGSELSTLSSHTSRSFGPASASRRSHAALSPSTLSRISEQPSRQGPEPSAYSSRSGPLSSRYQPTLSGSSAALSSGSRPTRHEDRNSSVSGSQFPRTICEQPEARSYYQPSLVRRDDGSYYDTTLKVSIEVEERSPDMYGCVNDGLKLDENGDYDLDSDLSSRKYR